ncbi:MAG: divalent-cation tolerance protein CutA [Acetobacteraceae bacterium]|nr:divalent-cation tolerance protein CutA [Acetobacteraceae bacterium]
MAEARIVLTTLSDDRQRAEEFAAALIERRLAACVTLVGPIRSVYRWNGNIERENEFLLIIKTTAEQAERLESAFKELHPYELPERIELSVEGGSEEYLSWIAGEVQGE